MGSPFRVGCVIQLRSFAERRVLILSVRQGIGKVNRQEILAKIKEKFPDNDISPDPLNSDCVVVERALIPALPAWLREEPGLQFDYLEFQTCVDYPPDRIELVYYLMSLERNHRIALKVRLPREEPSIPSVSHLWSNADWNEREIYDLFGVNFEGHPDLRRIMMPDDWEGHPLRKDYTHPNLVPRPD